MASFAPKLAALSVAGISGSYLLAQQQSALAEESVPTPTAASRRNLPIYDSPAPPATLVAAPSPLQDQVGEARRFLQSNYDALHLNARAGAQQWIGWENTAEAHVKAMLPEDEDLTPGALYVGVATLAGSILARNRNILLRAGLPSAFFLASLSHFLPKTFDRVTLMAEALERRYVPGFTGIRAQATGLLSDLMGRAGL
ncbi:apolipo protein O-domain-containing protein [Leucosporidium creatinivorum]|uniref:MICOS complex subunit n=1 Tax=Leucosporidium creatinivorum TaxID=106004 RepID=A0A1Y2CEE2_9BASI|nr:apolipo protein O-domain-containing protein [Leucosporidium creatinivorum]